MSHTLLWPKYRTIASGRVQTMTPSPPLPRIPPSKKFGAGLFISMAWRSARCCESNVWLGSAGAERETFTDPVLLGLPRLTSQIGTDDNANSTAPGRIRALLAQEGVAVDALLTSPWRRSSRPLVIAHRGQSAEVPANTLESFARAIDLGAEV